MSSIYKSFKDMEALSTYMEDNPGLVLRAWSLEVPSRRIPQEPRAAVGAEIWHPPEGTVIAGASRGQLSITARNQINNWWVAGAGDETTPGDPSEFDPTDADMTTNITDDNDGNGRQFFFGGDPGQPLQFRSAVIHAHGTTVDGSSETVTVYGITPAGGLVQLGTVIEKEAATDTSINVVTADDVTGYVGIQFATENIGGDADFYVDIMLIAD